MFYKNNDGTKSFILHYYNEHFIQIHFDSLLEPTSYKICFKPYNRYHPHIWLCLVHPFNWWWQITWYVVHLSGSKFNFHVWSHFLAPFFYSTMNFNNFIIWSWFNDHLIQNNHKITKLTKCVDIPSKLKYEFLVR